MISEDYLMDDYVKLYCETCQKELATSQEYEKCYGQKHELKTKIKIITDG